jgi:phytanoyl-CoA hydroxylase
MAGLTAAQRTQFEQDGYLVVENVLDPERDIDPVMAEYAGVLDRLADRLHAEGAIISTWRGLPFNERLIQICIESDRNYPQHFDFSLPQTPRPCPSTFLRQAGHQSGPRD